MRFVIRISLGLEATANNANAELGILLASSVHGTIDSTASFQSRSMVAEEQRPYLHVNNALIKIEIEGACVIVL